jgi:Na+-driven multidrug efflux pump
LGNAFGCALFLFYYAKGRTLLNFHRRHLRLDLKIVGEIFRVGFPASLETMLTSATFVVLNNLAVGYGELTVAAMGISQKLMSLGGYIYQGFAAGLQPLMAYNYGAQNYSRMLRLLKANILVIGSIELCVMTVFGITAPQLIGLFTQNAEVIAIGSKALRINMWILPFVGAISSCRASFQAMGKPLYALGITVCRQMVFFIPLLLLFNRMWGFTGLLCAQPVTECVMMIISIGLLRWYLRKSGA